MARLLIVDDHVLLREGLRRSMGDCGLDVVGEGGNGREALELTRQLRPDVVLMDISMPLMDGVTATGLIHQELPRTRVVMLTMHTEAEVRTQAWRAGAAGYLVKDRTCAEVAQAVLNVAGSEPPAAVPGATPTTRWAFDDPESWDDKELVSDRESQVLQLVADGLSIVEVAAGLFISPRTVKNHLASVYRKLGATDKTQAVLRGFRLGVIRIDREPVRR